MNSYLYSAKNNSFYPIALKEQYELSSAWPSDGVEVDDQIFTSFQNAQTGKVRIAGKDGYPAWGDIPLPTSEELVKHAESQKNALRQGADLVISPLQDASDLEIATDEEVASLKVWKTYRVMLNRVDTSKAPEISWPALPK